MVYFHGLKVTTNHSFVKRKDAKIHRFLFLIKSDNLRKNPQDSVLERHLYAVSINRPCEVSFTNVLFIISSQKTTDFIPMFQVRRLTAPGYSHSVDMSPDCTMLTSVFSSVNSLPGCQVAWSSISTSTSSPFYSSTTSTTFSSSRCLQSPTRTTRWTGSAWAAMAGFSRWESNSTFGADTYAIFFL